MLTAQHRVGGVFSQPMLINRSPRLNDLDNEPFARLQNVGDQRTPRRVAVSPTARPCGTRQRTRDRSDPGVAPKAKAGVGSAVNDATRLLGSTLGVAVVGNVYASIYSNRLTARLPTQRPAGLARRAHESVGGAIGFANRTGLSGHPALANAIHAVASSAFFDSFGVACLVVAGVSAASPIVTVLLLPAHPALPAHPEAELVLALPSDDQGTQLTPEGATPVWTAHVPRDL